MSIESSLVKLANKIDADGASNVSPEYKNPNNSVEKSLERIADNYEAGGGTSGGVLKVKMTWSEDYSSCTLDKTYAEIYSAFQNGFVISIGEEADTGALSLWMVCEVGYINETYGVGILPMHNLQSGPVYFIAETENSYPVFSQ